MNGEAGEMILEECCKDEGWMGQARENAIATSVIKESAKGGVRHEPSSQKKKKKKRHINEAAIYAGEARL